MIHSAAGVLLSFGIGMRAGGFTIRDNAGQIVAFAVARLPFRVDGVPIDCPLPPRPGEPRNPRLCPRWPATLHLGATRVRVTYWEGAGGAPYADSLTTLPHHARRLTRPGPTRRRL